MPYITKEQAAKILRTSTRGVERLVSRGKLHVTPEKVEGRTRLQPMYDEQQVGALAAEMTPDAASIATNGDGELATNKDSGDTHPREIDDDPTVEPTHALQRAPSEQSMQALAPHIAAALHVALSARIAVPAPSLLLSIPEAAAWLGVSKYQIEIAIHDGKLIAPKIGRGRRVRPEDLLRLKDKLFATAAKEQKLRGDGKE
jgi:excisionase family DNA binding protein